MKAPSKTPRKAAAKSRTSASAGRKKVQFSITANAGSDVSVAGSFSDWQTLALVSQGKGASQVYTRSLFLPPGHYEYKFVVNGEWMTDPQCPDSATNSYGTTNSLLKIG